MQETRLFTCKKYSLKAAESLAPGIADKAEEIALIENIQRQDLHPVEIANALLELSEKRGWGGQSLQIN